MNINVRIRRYHQRLHQKQTQAVTVPPWSELQAMDTEQVQALASRMGIEWQGRMKTLGEIHRSRQTHEQDH